MGIIEVYEWLCHEYGCASPQEVEARFTDEQVIAFWEAGQKRVVDAFTSELDRLVHGVNWGVAIAHDPSGRVANKWNRMRQRQGRGQGGLSGAALERAVAAIGALDSSLVKVVEGAQ